ncbi:MAG: ABC-F family ATP-binding cassette domain-containing protein, partial [Oscillospiraceae bacterium]
MGLLKIRNLSHSFGDKKIFSDAELNVFTNEKIGITGLNGAGKTTLFNILTDKVLPDNGTIKWNPNITYGYLDQKATIDGSISIFEYLKTAFADLYDIDEKAKQLCVCIDLEQDLDKQGELLKELDDYQEKLLNRGFYSIEKEVKKVANGLGIDQFGLDTTISTLSGGQRAKVILAKLLLQAPNLLLLDEPTNFLDKSHIDWLIAFLVKFKGSFLLISHDFELLDQVTNCICDVEFSKITKYKGNYASFMKQKSEKQEQHAKNYSSQQKEVAKLEDFISRNMARASTSKMAKGRQKKLDKIDRIEKPTETLKPSFEFVHKSIPSKKIISVQKLSIGYFYPLLPTINLEVNTGEKIAITGFNGIGKSTFLKTILGTVPALEGIVTLANNTVVGYYEQEHTWEDDTITPIQEIMRTFDYLTDKVARQKLSRCALKAEHANKPLKTLSGGEQAKVQLCKLTIDPKTILFLDEPTNHLDVNCISHLKKAIKSFNGTVVFVSHDATFCKEVAD